MDRGAIADSGRDGSKELGRGFARLELRARGSQRCKSRLRTASVAHGQRAQFQMRHAVTLRSDWRVSR